MNFSPHHVALADVLQDLRGLLEQALLWVVRVDFEVLRHAAIVVGASAGGREPDQLRFDQALAAPHTATTPMPSQAQPSGTAPNAHQPTAAAIAIWL